MRNWLPENQGVTGRHGLTTGGLEPSTASGQTRGQHLLVVDNEPTVRTLIKYMLETDGFRVTEASSANEAIRVLSHADIDVLITDVQMPGMDGVELARVAESEHPEIPVLLMSGSPLEHTSSNSRDHWLFLAKPFSLADLESKVQQALAATAALPLPR
jgi:CheY-like chemotaxis protein